MPIRVNKTCGFFILPLFSTPFPCFQHPKTRWERGKKGQRGKGVTLSLDDFPLIRGVKVLRESMVFLIRISNFCFLFLLLNKPPSTTTFNSPISPRPSIYRPSEKSPEFQMSCIHRNYLLLAKPHPCWIMRPILGSCCSRSEVTPHPHTWIKMKAHFYFRVFFRKAKSGATCLVFSFS